MNSNIMLVGLDDSESLNNLINNSFEGFLNKQKNIDSYQAKLTFKENESNPSEAEFVVFLKGKMLVSKSDDKDMYKAIVKASDKMDTLISKNGKVNNKGGESIRKFVA